MPHQDLIDYQISVKQANIAKIAALNNTITTANQQITNLGEQNAKIDETVTILESTP